MYGSFLNFGKAQGRFCSMRHFPSSTSIFAKATEGSWAKLHHQLSAAARSNSSSLEAMDSSGNRSKAATQVGVTCAAIGREIGEVAPGFAARPHQHDHHVAVMARRHAQFDTGRNFRVAVEQVQDAGFDQRLVVHGAITDGIARVLFARMQQLAALREVTRAGQRGEYTSGAIDRIAAAMVPVQVRVNDQIKGRRLESVMRENLFEARRIGHAHALTGALVMTHSSAGLDQNPVVARFDDKTVERGLNTIDFVGGLVLRPQCFRDDAEHRAAIPPVGSGADQGDAAIAEFQSLQSAPSITLQSTLHELASALEQIGGVLGDLLAAFVDLLAAVH